tara:strand:+ start:1452 stop:2603 length:1152 start_codon:yes stop_codon:yes gene_type:complete
MTNYSHSRLSTFGQCKYKYKLQYIDKVKVDIPTTVEAFMGSIVHKTLEKLYNDLKYQRVNELKDLLIIYNDNWEKEWTDDILIVKKEYTADDYKKSGKKFITDYYNHYNPFDQMTIIGLETQDTMLLPDGNSYHIRIDKLACKDDVYYVCDYKTNRWMKDQAEADEDKQLAMYSIWVKNRFKDAKKIVLLWHMLAFDKEVVSERTDEQLQKLQEDTIKVIKEVEECKEFPTTVTKLCDYCIFKELCPAFKHEAELEEKTVEEFKDDDGVKIVDEYSHLQTQKKEVQTKLADVKIKLVDFAKQKELNMVYGSNKKASVKQYSKVVYPENKEDFVNLVKEKGLYDEFSSLNYLKLGPRILKNAVDKDIIDLTHKEEDYRVSLSDM